MIHRGTADTGHYYAYIKDTETGQWKKFNDSHVTKADCLELIQTFGNPETSRQGRFNLQQPSENAYMLMYRRVDEEPVDSVPDSLIREEVQDEILNELKIEAAFLLEKQTAAEQMSLKVIYDNMSLNFKVN